MTFIDKIYIKISGQHELTSNTINLILHYILFNMKFYELMY